MFNRRRILLLSLIVFSVAVAVFFRFGFVWRPESVTVGVSTPGGVANPKPLATQTSEATSVMVSKSAKQPVAPAQGGSSSIASLEPAVAQTIDASDALLRGVSLTAEEISEREARLLADPKDSIARLELLGAYNLRRFNDPEIERKYETIVLWLVEFEPVSDVFPTRLANLDPVLAGEAYGRAVKLWESKLKDDPNNLRLLWNAGEFLGTWNSERAIEYLKRGQSLDPQNPEWSSGLSSLYGSPNLGGVTDSSAQTSALAEIERAISQQEALGKEANPNDISKAAAAAFEVGDEAHAEKYARQLIAMSGPSSAYYVHRGHQVLGRLALKSNDLKTAQSELLVSVEKSDGAVLKSFAPRFELAEELLQAGSKDTVLSYLNVVQKFWKPEQVRQWKQQILTTGQTTFKRDYSLVSND